jgi:hypothetical protein
MLGERELSLEIDDDPTKLFDDAPFECSSEDANVVAFAEAASIIGRRNAVEEFLACDIWPLSENCKFEVERKETPLSKVMVPMLKVTPTIGKQKLEEAFEGRIVCVANLLVGNYYITAHNACTGLHHG